MGFEILSIGNAAKEIPASSPLEILHIGQRTRLQGKAGLFVVVGLDPEHQTADVIATAGITPVLNGIPFARMSPLGSARADDTGEQVLPFPS